MRVKEKFLLVVTYLISDIRVMVTIVGIKKQYIWLVSCVTGVPDRSVRLIRWTTWVSAELLFMCLVWTPRHLVWPNALSTIWLFVVSLIGTSLFARLDLLRVVRFLLTTLLIGTCRLAPIIIRLLE